MDPQTFSDLLKLLDMPLMLAVAIISIVVSRYTQDRYDVLVPLGLGFLAGFIAEANTPELNAFMVVRRCVIYGGGGFIMYYLWRDKVTGWMDGAGGGGSTG